MSAAHEFGFLSAQIEKDSAGSRGTKFNYSVYNYAIGVNLQLKLVRAMTIIPWADYLWVDDRAAHGAGSKMVDSAKIDFADDLKILWNDRPRLNHGIDFAVQISRFELRLGGAFGAFIASGMGPENVRKNGFHITVAWNQKG